MSGMEGNPGSEVEKVANVIADAGRRRDFAANPEGTLTDAGVDVDQLPDGVRSTLFGLSHEELDVVSRVKESLDQAGVSRRIRRRSSDAPRPGGAKATTVGN